jgi:NIMA-interacting peptidyl-prolyl cis-trans isomerase 1
MTAALRRILFDATVLSILSMALACGGAASSAAPVATTLASPAEHCLAEAEAKHDRNPSEPDRISVKHILVRYQGAKGAAATIARTREQACLRAEEALSKLEGGASFAEVVSVYSDEPGAATREGTLGAIERADVAPAFADAAFELKVKEVSQVVETPFGFHVILRVE